MTKPIIGIIAKHYREKSTRPDTYIRDEVKQAIIDNGGIPIGIVPPVKKIKHIADKWFDNLTDDEYDVLKQSINICDGIIFQGGRVSDNYECIAAKYCYDNDIPTLGLCCGENIMVRALGGTTDFLPNPEKHYNHLEKYVHKITIDKTSKFYKIVKTDELMVNSRHKKTIATCPNLDKVAFCEDGFSEAVESKDKRFYIAVRFHPEGLYLENENMNNIFEEFIKEANKYKEERDK